MSNSRHILIRFTVVVALYPCLLSGCADVRESYKRSLCEKNLRQIYASLEKYVSAHGDVPRDQKGKPSLDVLAALEMANDYRIKPDTLKCPAVNEGAEMGYLVNPSLSTADFGDSSRTVIACDRPNNHPDSMLVLMGDGTLRTFVAPLKQREEWEESFLSGKTNRLPAGVEGP